MRNFEVSVEKMEVWKEFARHFKSSVTAEAYLTDIAEFELLTEKNFFQIRETEVQKYFAYLEEKEKAGSMSMNTFAKKFWELHSFAAFAVERREEFIISEEFEDFFFSFLKRIRAQNKFVHSVPVDDMDRLYRAAEGDDLAYTIIALLHRVGLSSTEIIALQKENIICCDNGTFLYIEQRQDICVVPSDAATILSIYLRSVEDLLVAQEHVFFNRYGKPLNKMYISRMLKKYTSIAKIPGYSAEKIRTTCGITMSAYGAKPGQVAKQMGITRIQIQKYKKRHYVDEIQIKANELVKIKIEPPNS